MSLRRRLSLLGAAAVFLATACGPVPPPQPVNLPAVKPWIYTATVVCRDVVGGIHYNVHIPTGSGAWTYQAHSSLVGWLNGSWTWEFTSPTTTTVNTHLPFQMLYAKRDPTTNTGFAKFEVASPVFQGTTNVPC